MKFIQPVQPDMAQVQEDLKGSFATGRLSNFGPANELFTERLTTRLRLNDQWRLLTTVSGHVALMTAYAVLGVRRLVVPAFTFESTRCAATLQGIEVLYADVDPTTGCLTVETLSKIKTSYDAVVYVCPLSTVTPDLFRVSEMCEDRGVHLIVDGAATFGTQGIHTYGSAFCLSFHATKTLGVGEGGAVILPVEHYEAARAYLNFGQDQQRKLVFVDGRRLTGLNGKMSEYSAAVGLSVLDQIDDEIVRRLDNAEQYRHLLGQRVPPTLGGTVYASMPTFAASAEAAVRVREALNAVDVANLAYYRPLVDLSVAADLYSRSVCLPVHAGVTAHDIECIASIYQSAEQNGVGS